MFIYCLSNNNIVSINGVAVCNIVYLIKYLTKFVNDLNKLLVKPLLQNNYHLDL